MRGEREMKLKGKRLLSWLMTVVMVLSMLPTTALAGGFEVTS